MAASVASLAIAALTSGVARANEPPGDEGLSADEVAQIIRQVVAEAQARDVAATTAVVDRVGNVLGVYVMEGAGELAFVDPGKEIDDVQGFAGLTLPVPALAINKAISGAYLSSNGNAFSTRTASQIIQENFNPGSEGLEGGPLFGVQFSQLPCSDLAVRFASNAGGTIDPRIGPKRAPAGFSADPGGFPIYQNGVLVGGVGVLADGIYGVDRDILDDDDDLDEILATAGTRGFTPDEDLRADRVTVDGRSLRYSDAEEDNLATDGSAADGVDLDTAGAFVAVRGYVAAAPRDGLAFGFGASGIVPEPTGRFGTDQAYILANAVGANRFPPRAGNGPGALNAGEVELLLAEALGVALQARGQIRRPLGSNAEVTISVVSPTGAILGIVRTPDAPVFGTDVSLQKARSAMTFSNAAGIADLRRAGQGAYVSATSAFIDFPLNGRFAFSNRAIGNLARPFYPDGQNGNPPGPLSVDEDRFSVFNTGLQVDLIAGNVVQHLGFVGGSGTDTPPRCAGLGRLANGLQIFAGGVPIYRGDTLVGGIGVSGDGIDQDDMIAFLGVDRAAEATGFAIANAPKPRRSDRLDPNGVNLRYVSCPFTPFLDDDDRQNVCEDG